MFETASNRRLEILSVVLVVLVWALLHVAFRDTFIFHDTYNHNFPQTYEVAKNSSCGQLAYWLSSDTGSPTAIYAISFSLTEIFKNTLVHLWSCTLPSPLDAMFIYKATVFVAYLGFALGMYVLGHLLFRHWLSALYLLTAALFTGSCLQSHHSDEVAYMMFWVPWCVAALVMALRHLRSGEVGSAAAYLNLAALFFCIELIDMYPHIPALAAVYAGLIYLVLYRADLLRPLIRVLPRLWPALIVVGLTVVVLYAVERQIFLFQPQHSRTTITVTPDQFGQTGFMQPSALFGWLFPLGFTAGFEEIASRYVWRGFIYRLDLLLIYIGTVPLFLALSLLPGGGNRRAALGWFLFALLMALTSMQPTGFYFAIFQLPFFNLFRSYIHFWDYTVIAFLVVSAYGFDRIAMAPADQRVAILRATFVMSAGLIVAGLATLIVFIMGAQGYGPGLRAYLWPIAGDVAIILIALGAIAAGTRRSVLSGQAAAIAVLAMVITQTIYFIGVYGLLGEPSQVTFARYKMDQRMLTPLDAADWSAPDRIRRVPCEKTTGCNLAQRPAASLRTDTDGSFFRDLQSPILRKDLPDPVKLALAGVTAPILWATGSLTPLPSLTALDEALAQYGGDLAMLLTRTTYVVGSAGSAIGPAAAPAANSPPQISFSDMKVSTNQISFRSSASAEGFANLSVTASNGWTASVGGAAAPIIRGFYNYVTVKVPAGESQVVLNYWDGLDAYLFRSRTALVLIALFGAAWLAWRVARAPGLLLPDEI